MRIRQAAIIIAVLAVFGGQRPARAHNWLAGYMYMAGLGDDTPYPPASDAELQRLLAMAQSDDPARRSIAVGALGQTGRVEALPLLENYARYRDGAVSYPAYLAFSGIHDARSAEAVLKLIREEARANGGAPMPGGNSEVAAYILRGIVPSALKPLETFAASLNDTQREQWQYFLSEVMNMFPLDQTAGMRAILDPAAPDASRPKVVPPASDDKGAAVVARIAARSPVDAYASLYDNADAITASKDPSITPSLRSIAGVLEPPANALALDLLQHRGDAVALDRLLKIAVHDKNAFARTTAIQALGRSKDPRAGKALLASLNRKPGPYGLGEEGGLAAISLGEIADPTTVPPLIKMLDGADKERAALAARALGGIGDRRAITPLLARAADKQPLLSGNALEALGEIGDRRATPATLRALHDPNRREAAVAALTAMKDPAAAKPLVNILSALNVYDTREVQNVLDAIAAVGPPAVEPLTAALKTAPGATRVFAASVLGRIAGGAATAALRSALTDKDARVRAAAVTALASQSGKASAPSLIGALKDADSSVRIAAATALWRVKAPEAHDALVQALTDRNPNVRTRAALAIADLGDDRGRALVLTWLKPDHGSAEGKADMQADAIRLVTEWKDPAAVGPLIEILPEDVKASTFDPGDHEDFERLAKLKVQALKTITGQDFGHALYRWTAWAMDAGQWTPPKDESQEEYADGA